MKNPFIRDGKITILLPVLILGSVILLSFLLEFASSNSSNDSEGNFEEAHQRLKTMKKEINNFRKSNELVIRKKRTFGKTKYDDSNLDIYVTMIDEYADELIEVYFEEMTYLFTQGTPEATKRANVLQGEFDQEYETVMNLTTDDDMVFHNKGEILRNNLQSKREVFEHRIYTTRIQVTN